ncbi:MAG: hypothetical protein QXW35_03470 [Candidatus Aenigmatarchaeota archaeon]
MKTYMDRLKVLLQVREETHYEICKTAYEIRIREEWKKAGYPDMKSYIEAELTEFGVDYSTFMYYTRVGEYIIKNNIDRKAFRYSNIRLLVSVDDKIDNETKEKLIEEAKKTSARKFKQKIEETLKQQKHKLKIELTDDEFQIVKQALDIAKNLAETENVSTLLTYICTDFIMNHNDNSIVVDTIKENVKRKIKKAKVEVNSNDVS